MEKSNQLQVLPMLSFGQAIKNVFSKYATFTGRARRSEYWWFQLFSFILIFLTSIFDELLGLGIADTGEGILSIIVCLCLILPSMSVAWRRLHDTNRSGWNFLWVIVPVVLSVVFALVQLNVLMILMIIVAIVMSVVLFVWYCLDSKTEENQYGPSPKYQEISDDAEEVEAVPM